MNRIDDPGPAPRRAAVDRLRIFEVRIHARGLGEEPGAKVPRGMRRVARLARDLPGGGQRRDLDAEAHQEAPVVSEVAGVRHPVALDVRAVGVLRVGPPVVALGKEIVDAAGAARAVRRRHGDRLFGKVLLGRLQHPLAIEGRHIEGGLARGPRKRAESQHTGAPEKGSPMHHFHLRIESKATAAPLS